MLKMGLERAFFHIQRARAQHNMRPHEQSALAIRDETKPQQQAGR